MKIFVLLSRFPYPLEKGDKLRAYNQIKYLSENHEIHLCALNDATLSKNHLDALKPFCKSINIIKLTKAGSGWNIIRAFFNGNPLQVGYFFSSSGKSKIQQLILEIKPDHIFCQLVRVTEYVKDLKIPKTLDYQDVFSKGVERRIGNSPWYKKFVLKMEYKRLLNYERDIFSFFNNKTIISEPDRELIPHPDRNKIEIVINGVDVDFFKPVEIKKEYDLVFIGNMGYPPNINAAKYLAEKVMPLVHEKLPEATLTLAGATPHPDVVALETEKIKVTGWMDDIRESYAKAKIFIAPMQIGTGLQNKLLEAMAMKIPCITSGLANKALEAIPEKEILVGDTPEEFAEHIFRLLKDKQLSETLSENAYKLVHSKYNWDGATKKLEQLIINTKA
ncbi:MAG: glycosyltransferase [Bacteroidetes bacterium]|nr:MAG: glycosyltransferase [Bacteroidota bacterium]